MTLSPIFRSERAIEVLRSEGIWSRIQEASIGQDEAIQRVCGDLPRVLDDRFLNALPEVAGARGDEKPKEFVQTFFFLILFRSILKSVGVERRLLDFCSELNFCIQGTIVAADNLFDGEHKQLLPLRTGKGPRFASILQLLAFQRLMTCACDRALGSGLLTAGVVDRIRRELMSRMADIGSLEGSEEPGVNHVLDVETMVERVHRVRGGQLFELSVVAPAFAEAAERRGAILSARHAISRLGTAFQMVDDLTDLQFDVRHGRHNLLVAQIHQAGTLDERAVLRRIREAPDSFAGIEPLVYSASAVLDRARHETRLSLEELADLGFWWPPRLADELVCAIVGLDGLKTMDLASRQLFGAET